jgi:hypothetical protein
MRSSEISIASHRSSLRLQAECLTLLAQSSAGSSSLSELVLCLPSPLSVMKITDPVLSKTWFSVSTSLPVLAARRERR